MFVLHLKYFIILTTDKTCFIAPKNVVYPSEPDEEDRDEIEYDSSEEDDDEQPATSAGAASSSGEREIAASNSSSETGPRSTGM